MGGAHSYAVQVVWTGNRGAGTSDYRAYDRAHEIRVANKPTICGSAEPVYRGDPTRHNPEELLVAALSACHMLWFLHLAADAGIVVVGYRDDATGTMHDTSDGGGRFSEVVLHPSVTTSAPADESVVDELHRRSHDLCYIARSVNFPVRCEAIVESVAPGQGTERGQSAR
jgi:organic hydroperoxide reductase OsmC/OhrA